MKTSRQVKRATWFKVKKSIDIYYFSRVVLTRTLNFGGFLFEHVADENWV